MLSTLEKQQELSLRKEIDKSIKKFTTIDEFDTHQASWQSSANIIYDHSASTWSFSMYHAFSSHFHSYVSTSSFSSSNIASSNRDVSSTSTTSTSSTSSRSSRFFSFIDSLIEQQQILKNFWIWKIEEKKRVADVADDQDMLKIARLITRKRWNYKDVKRISEKEFESNQWTIERDISRDVIVDFHEDFRAFKRIYRERIEFDRILANIAQDWN